MFDATPFLRLYANRRRRRLEKQSGPAQQERQLRHLVHRAQETRFGRDHDFADIRSVADFQARVPLRRYEDFWAAYWKAPFPILEDISWPGRVPYFAVTSGTTTGETKYIPCTGQMNRSNRRAALDILVHHIANHPQSRVLAGKNFMLGGSTAFKEEAPGVHSGDLSGIAAATTPWWARPWAFPPDDLALISDWEQKIDAMARASLTQSIRSISGTPSWLLLFLEKLAGLSDRWNGHLVDCYPDLDLLVHGGVNFEPYRQKFDQLLEGSHAETREVYPASEGFIAVADRGSGEGLRLIVDNGLFFEFVPVEELDADKPTRHWLGDAEPGVNYALVVSNCAGLWGYILGDTVRFVDLQPARLLITGRTAYMLSAFGEHLIAEEIDAAIAEAARAIDRAVSDYAVGAVFPKDDQAQGGHLYIVEFAETDVAAPDLEKFAGTLDRDLAATNEDYRAHRAEGYGMKMPEIRTVAAGTFAAWMKKRGKLGGQHKVPRIMTDQDLFDDLVAFAADRGRGSSP